MPVKPAPPVEDARRVMAAESEQGPGDDRLSRRETLELVRAYYRIRDPSARQRVLELVKSMGPPE